MSELVTELVCPAPAKLNLFLHVTGRRKDGYHLLQTVFCFLDFSDQLTFTLRQDGMIRLRYPIPGVPEESDLCMRAARLLQQSGNVALGVDIGLEKHIPMGGGLGGGSSDAATVLLALNRLWNLNWSKDRLMKLGVSLGADVPVFIFGNNAFAEGIGEKLVSVALPPAWYLVLTPPVHVPTAAIFASNELTRNTIPIRIPPFSVGQGHNDLEPVVCKAYPEVARHLAWLRQLQQDGHATMAAMTGSGACVFARFDTGQQARSALSAIPDGMKGFVAQGLSRHPMHDFAQPIASMDGNGPIM